jgi:hypothetical protein
MKLVRKQGSACLEGRGWTGRRPRADGCWLRSRPPNPAGEIAVITDNLSKPLRLLHWHLAGCPSVPAHPPGVHPGRACWRNLQEAWWRIFRRDALAGQSFARSDEITLAIEMATCQLNARARLWVWAPWRPHHATDDASSPTAFRERSTSRWP